MRTSLLQGFFFLHLSHVKDSLERFLKWLDNGDDDQHDAENSQRNAGVGGPEDVSGHLEIEGQVNKKLNQNHPYAKCDHTSADGVQPAFFDVMADGGHGRQDQPQNTRNGEGQR